MTIDTKILIIGGGPSGLFAASNLLNKNFKDFVLIENKPELMGGLAAQGWMKIGLFPAGKKTAEAVGIDNYLLYSKYFIEEYKEYLIKIERMNNCNLHHQNIFERKYYESYLLSSENYSLIVNEIRSYIFDKIIFGNAISIDKNETGYSVKLGNGNIVRCKSIIIATGRSNNLINNLINIGECFSSNNDIYFGCRACFKTKNAESLFLDQPDFRLKNQDGFRTYCFNYNGVIKELFYNGMKYYSGTLVPGENEGNVFIGKKEKFIHDEVISIHGIVNRNTENSFVDGFMGSKYEPYFYRLANFIKEIEHCYRIEFTRLLFPALEQFWPRPTSIGPKSIKSNYNDIYYIGDSSGISFGVLQCYATASYASDLLS